MEILSRRTFTRDLMGSLLSLSLLRGLCAADALDGPVRAHARRWLVEMEEVTKAMRAGGVRQAEWQKAIEALLARVEMKDLLAAIDYERLAKSAVFPEDHESAEEIAFTPTEGLPAELSFMPFFYAMRKGVAIVPHGHRNMASMHMILKGRARGRHYERVSDDETHIVVRQTDDREMGPGVPTTVSDEHDNVHWFRALTEPVFMFNVGVFKLDPAREFTGRDYIDPDRGETLPGGLLRTRRLEVKEAYKLYGKS